ncbi:uncharacterized protein [Euphorbia lathyris]|uniref:uncharacterized protein isoform X6 n=1 Tax=Euphorbia lathyris TaxID=212925 RepID=UPI0033135BF6
MVFYYRTIGAKCLHFNNFRSQYHGLFGPPRSFRKQSDINRENEELKRTRPHAVSPRQLLSRRDSHCLAETTTVSPRQNANQQRKLRKERRQQVRVEEIDIPPEEEIPQPEEMANPPSIMELLKATRPTATSSLVQPAIAAASFEIKPAMIQMIQNSGQFGGEYHEDPNAHLNKFTLYCSTFKYNNVTTEDVYMTLFRFSLKDEAADWLASLEPGSLADWDSTVSEFLAKYFPPSKTAQLRSDINCFKQFESENLHLAWERFQKLMRKCPHHGFEKHRLVQLFYSGISSANRASLDTAAGGNLFSKTAAVAYSLVKELAERSAHWQIEKPTPRRGVFAVEAPSSKSVGTSESNSQAVVRSSYLDSIGHCLGEAHAETECKSEILIWIILGMDLDECDGMKGMEKVYVNLARVDPFHDPTTHLSRTRCNEVWAYERRILPSQSRHRSRVPRLPLMTRWREFDLGTEKRRTVARLLDWIDSRTLGQIKFRWDDLDFGPDYAYVTLIQEQECVLTGPCVRAWYLGDRGITGIRASHWSPGEIPVSMFAVRTMPLSVIRQDLTRRFVGREVWVHAGGRDLYLSTLLSTRDAPAVAMDVDPVADVFSWEAVAAVFGQEEVPEGSWRSAHLSDFFDGARA